MFHDKRPHILPILPTPFMESARVEIFWHKGAFQFQKVFYRLMEQFKHELRVVNIILTKIKSISNVGKSRHVDIHQQHASSELNQ